MKSLIIFIILIGLGFFSYNHGFICTYIGAMLIFLAIIDAPTGAIFGLRLRFLFVGLPLFLYGFFFENLFFRY
jgi:hypothetical protein